MSVRSFFGLETKPDASFEIVVPSEITGITLGSSIAPRISRREALQVPAVLRGRNIITTPAGLPIHIRDKGRRIAHPTTLLDQINPDVPNIVTMALTYEDLLFEAISWWRVLEFGFHGYPTFAEHLDHTRVHVAESEGRVFVDGQPVAENTVIRFDSPNPALLVHAARAIRTCLALDSTASRYATDAMPLGLFHPKEGRHSTATDEEVEAFLDKFEEARQRRVWGWIPGAVDLEKLQFDAEQIQLADQRQHAVLEIARAIGVDPEDLGVSTTSRTYQNSEQRRQDMIDFTLSAYMKAIEQRLSMGDITPRGYEAKVNLDAFLRADTKTRMETYAIGEPLGIYPPERLAELEDIPRVVKPKPVLPNVSSVGDNAAGNGQVTEEARP